LLLVVGVLLDNCLQDWHGFAEILSVYLALGGHGHWHTRLLRNRHGQAYGDGHGHRQVHRHRHWRHGLALVDSVLLVLSLVLLIAALVVVTCLAPVFTLLVAVVLLAGLAHVLLLASLVVVAVHSFATLVGGLLGWFLEVTLMHKKSEQVDEFVRILEISQGACIFGLVALEVLLVLLGLVVHITVLLNLVMVDVQGMVVELLLG